MTPRDLIASFDALAEAPNGVARLRDLVLELAVRGRLVPQDPNDEPASVLLERIATAKAERRQSAALKNAIAVTEGGPDRLPSGWVWTCTAAIGNVNPRYFRDDGSDAGFVPMSAIPTEFRGSVRPEQTNWAEIRRGYTHLSDGDVAVAKITPCFQNGKSCVMRDLPGGIGAGTTELHVVSPDPQFIEPRYLLVFYKSPGFIDGGIAQFTGTAGQQRVPASYFTFTPLPLPPFAEQQRIVARVDKLMTLLDRLEAARNAREATRLALRDAALSALQDAETSEAVEVAWNRIAGRMHDLFTEPADVAPLRQAVLQLAVRGRLVRQDPSDEPASKLLERIAAKRAELVAEGTLKRPKPAPILPALGAPFELPTGWAWSRLGDVLRTCRNGLSATPNDDGDGYPLLRISSATGRSDGWVDMSDHRFAAITASDAAPFIVNPSDLLACRFNGNLEYVGQVAQVPRSYEGSTVHPDKLIRLVAIEMSHPYLRIAINAEPTRKQVRQMAATTAGNIGINGKQVQSLVVPVPPLQEQTRIVARVDELMTLLDRLERQLADQARTHDAFAAAAVHGLGGQAAAAGTRLQTPAT